MELWDTRKYSISAMQSALQKETEFIYHAFDVMGEIIRTFEKSEDSTPFARVCGLTLAKGFNLSHGCLSLALDGLAQESGALLRPLIESIELLAYFRADHSRVDKATDGKLPSAGEIAKAIDGEWRNLRNHLNSCASHFSFDIHSIRHLIDWKTMELRVIQPYSESVLRRNMVTLLAILFDLIAQGVLCLKSGGILQDALLARATDFEHSVIPFLRHSCDSGRT